MLGAFQRQGGDGGDRARADRHEQARRGARFRGRACRRFALHPQSPRRIGRDIQWVPNTDVAVGKKAIRHISYDPRLSPAVMRAFEAAEDEVLINTLKGAPRLDVPDQFRPAFMAEVEKAHSEYFADLPPLK